MSTLCRNFHGPKLEKVTTFREKQIIVEMGHIGPQPNIWVQLTAVLKNRVKHCG